MLQAIGRALEALPCSRCLPSRSGDPQSTTGTAPHPRHDPVPDPRRPASPRPGRAPGALPTFTTGSPGEPLGPRSRRPVKREDNPSSPPRQSKLSRIQGSSWRSFLYSSSVYSCHLFLIMDNVYLIICASNSAIKFTHIISSNDLTRTIL